MPNLEKLTGVFEEARRLLDDPENNFDWTFWEDRGAALQEMDGFLSILRGGRIPRLAAMEVVFLPTGPLQEVSLSSGWGNAFVELAGRFDEAIAEDEVSRNCECLDTPLSSHVSTLDLGMDSHFAEVSILTCPNCGRTWLRYFYENEAVTGSGQWYLGAITSEQTQRVNVDKAKETLEATEWYFYGGSAFEGEVRRGSGPIVLCL